MHKLVINVHNLYVLMLIKELTVLSFERERKTFALRYDLLESFYHVNTSVVTKF